MGVLGDSQYTVTVEGREILQDAKALDVIRLWSDLLRDHSGKAAARDLLTKDEFLAMQAQIQDRLQVKGKALFFPLRVAVIGKPHGTDLAQLVPLLPVQSLIRRAESSLQA